MRLSSLAALLFFLIPGHLLGAALADPGWLRNWETTVKAAEEEGKLTISLVRGGNLEKVLDVFRKKHPKIQLVTQATSPAETGTRIMSERRSGKYLWDICICGTTTPYAVLYGSKALDAVKPALILPEVVDESKWWAGRHHYVDSEGQHIFVFVGTVTMPEVFYNREMVNPKELNSYWDLLQPKWKGKILSLDPRQAGHQRIDARILYHVPELGAKFLRALFTEMDVTLTRDDRQAVDWLASGRYALCILCRRADVVAARDRGLPIDEIRTVRWSKTPIISSGRSGTLALLGRAPNPNAAKVFINWLLSREGQIAFQQHMNSADDTMESLRVDIPKDPVLPDERRVEGVKYVVMDTPERSDQAPLNKLFKEIFDR